MGSEKTQELGIETRPETAPETITNAVVERVRAAESALREARGALERIRKFRVTEVTFPKGVPPTPAGAWMKVADYCRGEADVGLALSSTPPPEEKREPGDERKWMDVAERTELRLQREISSLQSALRVKDEALRRMGQEYHVAKDHFETDGFMDCPRPECVERRAALSQPESARLVVEAPDESKRASARAALQRIEARSKEDPKAWAERLVAESARTPPGCDCPKNGHGHRAECVWISPPASSVQPGTRTEGALASEISAKAYRTGYVHALEEAATEAERFAEERRSISDGTVVMALRLAATRIRRLALPSSPPSKTSEQPRIKRCAHCGGVLDNPKAWDQCKCSTQPASSEPPSPEKREPEDDAAESFLLHDRSAWQQCTSADNTCLGGCATKAEHERYRNPQWRCSCVKCAPATPSQSPGSAE